MYFFIPNTITFDVEISSDKTDSFDELQNLLDQKESVENELAEKFYDQLVNNASKALFSSKDRYIEALSVNNGIVTLDTSDFVVHLVEDGNAPYDMKPGLLNSPKAKVGKDGKKYLVVPVSKYKQGRYNWRDRSTGRFDKGSNIGGDVEFRIVSENSPPDSWQHPGHAGYHFINQTLDTFDEELDSVIDAKINVILNKF